MLVDTSVWIDHLRVGDPLLVDLLGRREVLMHPFIRGELACGNLRNRQVILSLLHDLPASAVAGDDEVMTFIERHSLMGKGIGYVDAHLLAAVALSAPARLWTLDRALASIAKRLHVSMSVAR